MNTLFLCYYYCNIVINANFVSIIGVLVGLIGVAAAIRQYRKSNEIKRAEFCTRIFELLFKDPTYSNIREELDPLAGFTKEYDETLKNKYSSPNTDYKDSIQLTNYLNFFEYILILQNMRVIKNTDVMNLFEYYLSTLSKSNFIKEYCKNYGFEHLNTKFDQINKNGR